jgi:hypothetical protein
MRKLFLLTLSGIFIIYGLALAAGNQDEAKKYLSDMGKVIIDAEEAIRNVSMKILPPKDASEQIASSAEKLKLLKPPGLFSKDHYKMLMAFESLKDGLKLFSKGENEKAKELVRKGASLLKEAAVSIKAIAEKEGLIPVKPKSAEPAKPLILTQSPSAPGIPSIPGPNISSPEIKKDSIVKENSASMGVNLSSIPAVTVVPSMPPANQNMMLAIAGKVVSISSMEEHFLVMLKDDSENKIEIHVKPLMCNILKDNKKIELKDVNPGDVVYVVYTQNNNTNQALFMHVLQPEEVKAFKNTTR